MGFSTIEYDVEPRDFRDWRELHGLLNACFAYMDGRIDPPSSLLRMSANDLRAKAASESLVIARANGLVGCAFMLSQPDAILLSKIAVAPEFRRCGVLRRMIEIAEDHARQHCRSALALQTRVELTENHRTFAALGFIRVGETAHAGYDRPTSITMRKTVEPV